MYPKCKYALTVPLYTCTLKRHYYSSVFFLFFSFCLKCCKDISILPFPFFLFSQNVAKIFLFFLFFSFLVKCCKDIPILPFSFFFLGWIWTQHVTFSVLSVHYSVVLLPKPVLCPNTYSGYPTCFTSRD